MIDETKKRDITDEGEITRMYLEIKGGIQVPNYDPVTFEPNGTFHFSPVGVDVLTDPIAVIMQFATRSIHQRKFIAMIIRQRNINKTDMSELRKHWGLNGENNR